MRVFRLLCTSIKKVVDQFFENAKMVDQDHEFVLTVPFENLPTKTFTLTFSPNPHSPRKVVPETYRATLYNFFRVPLNAIVCCVLLANVSVSFGFALTSLMLLSNLGLSTMLTGMELSDGTASATNGTTPTTIDGTNSSEMDNIVGIGKSIDLERGGVGAGGAPE